MVACLKRSLLVCILPLLFSSLYGQIDQDRPIRYYFTQKMNNGLSIAEADYGQSQSKIERELADQQRFHKLEKVVVPIVFHILHQPGRPAPTAEQVWWQLAVLNQDFAAVDYQIKHPADTLEGFSQRVSDTEITFCIASTVDQGKNAIPGIHFVETSRPEWGANWDMCRSTSRGTDPVDPDQYLNVWVVDLADTVSGWASYPFLSDLKNEKPGADLFNGIVLGFDFFGQDAEAGGTALPPYNEGKTLSHLVGNYLGLYDLWDEYNPCADDYVADTPVHNAPNYGCQIYKHVTTCHEQAVEMVMNFMDNSDDACQRMFTQGQKLRMQGMFAPGGPRAGLLNTPTACSIGAFPEVAELEERARFTAPETPATEGLKLQIWPNPSKDLTNIALLFPFEAAGDQTPIEMLIYTSQGQLQQRISDTHLSGDHHWEVQTADWPSGVYRVMIYTTSGSAGASFIIQN
jgi:hypothetical protein